MENTIVANPLRILNLRLKLIVLNFVSIMTVITSSLNAQILGANYNHDPQYIQFEYLEETGVKWVRTTPRILNYYLNEIDIYADEGLQKIIEAGERGYKIAFGFRWDFRSNGMSIPEPGSDVETEIFELQREIMNMLAPHINIFKLGNEPNLETLREDMFPDEKGNVRLVQFTLRQLEKVVLPFFNDHPQIIAPKIFIGSFPRMFMPEEQNLPAVQQLIKMANDDYRIDGLAIHLHISEYDEIDQSFEFVRSIMPDKPIIVPEFSFHRLFVQKTTEILGNTTEGKKFCKKWGRDPEMKLYEWSGIANSYGVHQQEWYELFLSRDWFPHNFLRVFRDKYKENGVILATYPIFQQSAPGNPNPNSPMWFINPVFSQKSMILQENCRFAGNPLVYEDFLEWANDQ